MYEQPLLTILCAVGERGISVRLLARHVYNMSSTLFYQPDFDEVYDYVRRYIRNEARKQGGMVAHAAKWGYYRLNTRGSQRARLFAQQARDSKAANNTTTDNDD